MDTYSADFIQGKGEGHIFLLHGPPGVGKTLTAECVAEYTERPLLPLTGGDIGSTAIEVERNLRKYLRRGQDWNAVVLLDEAHVYLSARDFSNSIEHNSVVSVFLREVEYYRGILFLTTNRVGNFDEAITSRIHFSLHFNKFTPASRKQIWKNNLRKLGKERRDVKVDYNVTKYIDNELLNLDWNGREIRNAFQTAVSLALFDSKHENERQAKESGSSERVIDAELTVDHIQQVVDMSDNFKKYINSTHGEDPATTAKFKKLRDDDFGNSKDY
ncbi:P-loop containing nucleoside triphosphate hydrolase protein [Viridothelium virens]|uniref:P-loop containing nucleoside triphosphate hydrolase protein n=1 Tax=Viridothelium virens TaxID=1048519 RepID=A0A6A6H694_VIRVR|nr:P-loop containing nucleoside triphosphate hydrolase protein [Viridothelium virens]